ncbi:hypothetical protein JOF56_007937 [Kibdelosporangium banguiense]|uniref:Uncharacterized protein n=1 Tax=Kibdelosporangium banguiense TaxID=1365924 RepID=A0ABS4TT36_9PSEU|nr:hypothetical protein [Kibdelosporangium banguiense]
MGQQPVLGERGQFEQPHPRPGKASCVWAATRNASRVLPTPATPVNVTSRARRTSRTARAISRRRPTKLVTAPGRLPTSRPGPGTRRHGFGLSHAR